MLESSSEQTRSMCEAKSYIVGMPPTAAPSRTVRLSVWFEYYALVED